MKKSVLFITAIAISIVLIAASVLTIEDFFLPGSQIGQSGNLESPDRCDNCHGGYDQAVEPAFNWRGSMMAQAARDPLFYACLAIANQDAPQVGDLCLRCHTPDGWLNGRCVPTDGSALNNNDRQGVQCDFCHKLVKPLQKSNGVYVNPFPGDNLYTSPVYNSITFEQDKSYVDKIIPVPGTSSNGMYLADSNNGKRGPLSDATGRHQMFYSPFHKEAALCGTCHDVSNPVFTRSAKEIKEYSFNEAGMRSETFDLRLMFPVERTYSEWLASSYNSVNGKTCQDCHMKDVTGKAAKMKDAKLRTDLPLHDFTGGNTFVPLMVKDKWVAEVDAAALDAGIERARKQLQSAADMSLTVDVNNVSVKVTNKTGHKLPTGYPEGRRMWINVKVFNDNDLVWESGEYDNLTAILKTEGTKIYECKPGFSQEWANTIGKTAGPSFNFAINNKIWFDNRIPPAGFTNAALEELQSPVVNKLGEIDKTMYPDGQNWDKTDYVIPTGITFNRIEARLMYQTTSKEYVEFLKNENRTNTAGQELYDLWVKHGKSKPEIMNEAFWGNQPIAYMTAGFKSVGRESARKSVKGVAEVQVKSGTANVAGATVFAEYSGPNSGTLQVITDPNGIARLQTRSVNNPTGNWCFTILNVTHDKYSYVIPKPFTRICEGDVLAASLKNATNSKNIIQDNIINVYPNPFIDRLQFEFISKGDNIARIDIYDMAGRQMKTIFDNHVKAGEVYRSEFIPDNKTNGVYIYRLTIGEKVYNGKVVQVN